MIVWLDMDGVLADFDKKSIELIGKRLSDFPDSASGWAAMNTHKDIYSILEPMPDAKDLVVGIKQLTEKHGFKVGVLTAIPKFGRIPDAEIHKKKWIDKYYPHLLDNFRIGPHAVNKQEHCIPGDVLIDDSTMNIPQWNARGGFGILHTSAAQSLSILDKYLK